MTVVVTGASGHIGANLVRALIAEGRSVRSLVHINHRAIDGLGTEIVSGDVRDRDSLDMAFRGADCVYHLAAGISLSMAGWQELEQLNVIGTRNVVESCLSHGVRRLVHFSSIHAISQEPFTRPVDEDRPPAGGRYCPPYDRSKAAAEMEIRGGIERGLDAVIVNPTAVIGPYDFQPSYFGEALLAIARGRLPALVTGGFDWVDVRDVVAGAMAAEAKASKGSRYLLSGEWVSLCDLAAMVAQITGVASPGFVCPLWLARLGAPVMAAFSRVTGRRPLYTSVSMKALKSNRDISHEKATRDLGYQPRPFRQTLVDTLRWFAENGYIEVNFSEEKAGSP